MTLLKENKIDILIYQEYEIKEIQKLIQIKEIKTIFINRSCFLHWIYYKQPYLLKHLYKIYQKAKYHKTYFM